MITVLAAPAWSLMTARLSSAVLAMTPKPGLKRKVFEPAGDDGIGDTHVDHIRQIVAAAAWLTARQMDEA